LPLPIYKASALVYNVFADIFHGKGGT